MTDPLACDYSFGRPDPVALHRAGYLGAGRYLAPVSSSTRGKILTASEARALHAAGLGIWLVFESTAGRALGSRADGAHDRQLAEAQAHALGYPATSPIFYAVDTDVDPARVRDYFAGVATDRVYPAGVYGSRAVVEHMLDAKLAAFGWHNVWRGGTTVSHHAGVVLYQRQHRTAPHAPAGIDENVIVHPFPMWVPAKPGPAPQPRPPAPHPANPDHELVAAFDKWRKAKAL